MLKIIDLMLEFIDSKAKALKLKMAYKNINKRQIKETMKRNFDLMNA